jgi:NAD(P)-dependent dehydrogenase (short-subunit alcohol dehydrogenase family)
VTLRVPGRWCGHRAAIHRSSSLIPGGDPATILAAALDLPAPHRLSIGIMRPEHEPETRTMSQLMRGKTCIVTGASAGIGKSTARALAARGANVVLVCRDRLRGDIAMREVASQGSGTVKLFIADLSSQRDIRRVAREILDAHPRIDVLVNNAGGIFGQRQITADGLELTFALNHLAYFLLTSLLLERIVASAPARIINVSSGAHQLGRLDWNNLQGESSYSPLRVYGLSKLANILFTYELARRLAGTGVTVNCMHPGGVATNFGATAPGLIKRFFGLFRPLLRTPEQGADTIVWLATARELEGVTGKYFHDRKDTRSSKISYDEQAARRLWIESARMVGLEAAYPS